MHPDVRGRSVHDACVLRKSLQGQFQLITRQREDLAVKVLNSENNSDRPGLKEKNPDIQIWGIDSYGSVFKKYHETREFDSNEIYSYITEGIGEDIIPKNVEFDLIDKFEKVTDKDGALAAREIAIKEGLLLGYSCGSAFQGLRQLKHLLPKNALSVVLFHDHGSRYINKIYNDDWMKENNFL